MKKIAFTFLIVFGCFLAANQTKAFSDNFDTYTNGATLASSSSNWIDVYSPANTLISNSQSTSSPNSAYQYNNGGADVYNVQLTGDYQIVVSAYLRTENSGFNLDIRNNTNSQICAVYTDFGNTAVKLYGTGGGVQFATSSNNIWHSISLTIYVASSTCKATFDSETSLETAILNSVTSTSTAHVVKFGGAFNLFWDNFSFGKVTAPCSFWSDYANCIWEGNPVYPTGDYGTGNCQWTGPADGPGPCTTRGTFISGSDEPYIYSQSPVTCDVNVYSGTATMTIPFDIKFFNPPTCSTTALTVCSMEAVTYYNLGAYFYDSYNNETSTTLISVLAPNSAQSYVGNFIIPAGSYRMVYKAQGVGEFGEYVPFEQPSCCTVVSNTEMATSSPICNWGTQLYSTCQNAYSNCIASSTSFLENITCGIQGAFWSIFCPNPEALAKTKNIITDAKNRFPITIVTAFSKAFSSYSTSSTATSTATTTFMAADISGFDQLGELSFFVYLRTLLTALGIIAIGVFTLKYTQAHFFNK